MNAQELVIKLQLLPHPEGGFYRETYRASEKISREGLPPRFSESRAFSTQIFYLLPSGAQSRLHRIRSDEIWHFYLGDPLQVVELVAGAPARIATLGPNLAKGQVLQHVVKAGTWFGAFPAEGSAYSLVGCSVAPAFEFGDLEMGEHAKLLSEFPDAKTLIERLT